MLHKPMFFFLSCSLSSSLLWEFLFLGTRSPVSPPGVMVGQDRWNRWSLRRLRDRIRTGTREGRRKGIEEEWADGSCLCSSHSTSLTTRHIFAPFPHHLPTHSKPNSFLFRSLHCTHLQNTHLKHLKLLWREAGRHGLLAALAALYLGSTCDLPPRSHQPLPPRRRTGFCMACIHSCLPPCCTYLVTATCTYAFFPSPSSHCHVSKPLISSLLSLLF